MMQLLAELLDDYQPGPSEFAMDTHIIADAGPTLWAQYMQTLRELQGRFTTLREMYFERQDRTLLIESMARATRPRQVLKRLRLEAGLAMLDAEIVDVERQFRHFYDRAACLKRDIGPITADRRNQLEAETWHARLTRMVRLDACNGGLQPRTAELVLNAPIKWREELLRLAQDRLGAETWFQTHKQPGLTKSGPIMGPKGDVQTLILEGVPQLE